MRSEQQPKAYDGEVGAQVNKLSLVLFMTGILLPP